jgi:hypothetical protein
MYHLDLKTVLQLLKEFGRDGILYTDLPPQVLGRQERYRGQLTLIAGKVSTCRIIDESERTLLLNDEAFNLLNRLGALNWIWTPQQVSAPLVSTNTVGSSHSPIPQRNGHTSSEELNAWPRVYRRVYVLVDGERNVEKIASMVGLSSNKGTEETLRILYELQRLGKVRM